MHLAGILTLDTFNTNLCTSNQFEATLIGKIQTETKYTTFTYKY